MKLPNLKRLKSLHLLPRTLYAAHLLNVPPMLVSIDTEKVLRLVDKGIDQQWTDKRGWTLLMIAAERMQPDVVQRLIERGADIEHVVPDDYYSLRMTPLHIATEKGNTFSMEHLLKAGAKIDARDARGKSPLFYGATDIDKLNLLLAYGADIHHRDAEDATPLMRAAAHSLSAEPVRELLRSGALADDFNNIGKTVMDYANFNSWPECVAIQNLIAHADAVRQQAVAEEKRATVAAIAETVQQTQRDVQVFRTPVRFKPKTA